MFSLWNSLPAQTDISFMFLKRIWIHADARLIVCSLNTVLPIQSDWNVLKWFRRYFQINTWDHKHDCTGRTKHGQSGNSGEQDFIDGWRELLPTEVSFTGLLTFWTGFSGFCTGRLGRASSTNKVLQSLLFSSQLNKTWPPAPTDTGEPDVTPHTTPQYRRLCLYQS